MKSSKELNIGEGGENKSFSHNRFSMGLEIITCVSPRSACFSIMSYFYSLKFEMSWV